MTPTYYPKSKEELDTIYNKAVEEHSKDNNWDFSFSALATPQTISKNPAPEGQKKVVDRDGNINLDPCRMIITGDSKKTQIEVPLEIYQDWIDDGLIRQGLDPRTGMPPQ
jgi:hypothetical protein